MIAIDVVCRPQGESGLPLAGGDGQFEPTIAAQFDHLAVGEDGKGFRAAAGQRQLDLLPFVAGGVRQI